MTFQTKGVRVIRPGEGGLVSGAIGVQGMTNMVFNRYFHFSN